MMPVKINSVVAFRYIMKNSRGEVLENSMNASPTVYLHGAGGIQLYLQKQLEGLVAGDKQKVYLDDDYSFEVIIDGVREALPEEVLLGYPVVVECEDGCVCYGSH